MLRPGEKTLPLRQTASLLVAPFEGKGYSIIDGKRFDWNQFDTLAVPGGWWVEHHNGSDTEPVICSGPATSRHQEAVALQVVGPQGWRVSCCERPGAGQKGPLAMPGWNTKLLSHIDCPGGGQVWVEGTTLYVGHMRNPSGTTIVDISDPRQPRLFSTIDVPDGWHSHKVRVSDDIMIVNHEKLGRRVTPVSAAALVSTMWAIRPNRS